MMLSKEVRQKIHEDSNKVGNCLVWVGEFNTQGEPVVTHGKSVYKVRKLFVEMKGEQVNRKTIVCTCGNDKCIKPSHLTTQKNAAVKRFTMAQRQEIFNFAISHQQKDVIEKFELGGNVMFGKMMELRDYDLTELDKVVTKEQREDIMSGTNTDGYYAKTYNLSLSMVRWIKRGG